MGFAGGFTANPTYKDVCSGLTGHAEVVRIVFNPGLISYEALLKLFWENHNPTEGMQQGVDVGTQYRSAVYWFDEAQRGAAKTSLKDYETALRDRGFGRITTEIAPAPPFHFAEAYHQAYLAKTKAGYCGMNGTGVSCPIRPKDHPL